MNSKIKVKLEFGDDTGVAVAEEIKFKLDITNTADVSKKDLPDFRKFFKKSIKIIKKDYDGYKKITSKHKIAGPGDDLIKPLKAAFRDKGTINLVLVEDDIIKKINKKYRGIDAPTDVVSLSYLEGERFPGENLIGEIFISADTAKKQAHNLGHTLKEELNYLFAHGILHVFGYDHKTDEERKRMFMRQEEIIEGD